jgi:hypothetical protein
LEARPLPSRQRQLPAGIAMVSFYVGATAGEPSVAPPSAPPDDGAPYAGASGVACMRGAAGEMLELIRRV